MFRGRFGGVSVPTPFPNGNVSLEGVSVLQSFPYKYTTTFYSLDGFLIPSTQLKNFLATKWTAAKQFGLESGENLIPGMKEMFDQSTDLAVESIVIGLSHRGRLNVLGNVVRKPLRQIFSEFSGGIRPIEEVGLYTGTGNVKYPLGTSYDRPTNGGKRIHLSLVANPSHLEALV
ncbi:2-oxoglutarate dehydrogenase, mitochondrial-like protein [Tanacetum coccineum]|uniref:2-oxoglutarate dehydrogenase, mitochondrial-like protein n=1 Tax=Tanacetum coccineum TaxID=301880 RepID=A0ABQ5HSL0_9ASTR